MKGFKEACLCGDCPECTPEGAAMSSPTASEWALMVGGCVAVLVALAWLASRVSYG